MADDDIIDLTEDEGESGAKSKPVKQKAPKAPKPDKSKDSKDINTKGDRKSGAGGVILIMILILIDCNIFRRGNIILGRTIFF